ncbi:MAG: hypothetical protein SFY68_15115 [Candidatus Sumerlaeia bacterium]|nr:hypothetical protein [Candidatus Sumerlaeia bacterium]
MVKGTAKVVHKAGLTSEAVAKKLKASGGKKFLKGPNRLHPVQVEYSYPLGSRVNLETTLPVSLDEEEPEALLDKFSSPFEYEERLAPVSATLIQEKMQGKNPTELQVKFIRTLGKRLETVAEVLETANRNNFGETGPISFIGLGLDPATTVRIIDLDYETADNVYSRMARLWDEAHITPIVLMPFHNLMTEFKHDFEMRLVLRIAFEFYWPVVKKYNKAVFEKLNEDIFMMCVMFPEGGFHPKLLEMLHSEFQKRCEDEGIEKSHLILFLDCEQSKERETDALMKRWNTLRPSPTTRDFVSIIYKERLFSEWVIHGHPSTKKQLDRTIAKVDAVLRDNKIDHLWSHWEPLMTLLSTYKTCTNFEQKLIKLTELGYQTCGPDVFVRRKMLKKLGMEEDEPRRTTLKENTCWDSWEDTPGSLVRFKGVEEIGGFVPKKYLGADRHYQRMLPDGSVRTARGNPCWKPALQAAIQAVHRVVVGDPKTFMGGMLGLLREIIPIRRVPIMMRNIEQFLIRYARIHWKEHFIHHIYSEADIRLDEFARECLLANLPEDSDRDDLTEEEIILCGAAASAIYHCFEGNASSTFRWEHLDHRATYHNLTMLCTGVILAMHAYRWAGKKDEEAKLFQVYEAELMNFSNAFERHKLADLGVEEKLWKATIKSQVEDSPLNIVERVARRMGAIHLRPLGYRDQFDRKDSFISTATGHIWSHEFQQQNIKFENEFFCGMTEE